MSLLHELESIKYSAVVDLIKRDEGYDKKRRVINGEEVFNLCHERYQFLQSLLLPLKEILGNDINIIDIGFIQGMQEDTNILIKYNNNDERLKYLTILYSDLNDISIESSDSELKEYDFIYQNKKIIKNIFKKIRSESLDSEFYLNSTSHKFVIKDNCTSFTIKDVNEKIFSLEGNHSMYAKSGLMYDKEKIITAYSKLKEMLLNEENLINIYRHIHVYEEDFPKMLIKKLTDN